MVLTQTLQITKTNLDILARRYNLLGEEEDYKNIYNLLLQYGAEDTPATSPFVLCGKTAKEGLEDEHYEREYHRLVA